MPPRSSKRSVAAAKAKGNTDLADDDVVAAAAPSDAPPADEGVKVEDPLAEQQLQHHLHNVDQESALEAAEAAIGNVLGEDVGAGEDDEVAMAAAAAAAAVDPSEGMAVVVDQALLATAAAAAASQVAKLLSDHPTDGLPQDVGLYPVKTGDDEDDGDLLEARRVKDRKRYSAMTPESRSSYNAHRRELYHKQGEDARKRRRERERDRYHSLEGESKKQRNERRAKLERDRYNKLAKEELANRNERRRERAKTRKSITKTGGAGGATTTTTEDMATKTEMLPNLPEYAMDDVTDAAMADASAFAAEVAEQVIATTNLDASSSAVQALMEEGPTVQI